MKPQVCFKLAKTFFFIGLHRYLYGLMYKEAFRGISQYKGTKDSSNLISEEQKFVCWAFILEANDLQNAYMTIVFGSFGAKSLFAILMETQPLFERTNFFFFQTYTKSTIHMF